MNVSFGAIMNTLQRRVDECANALSQGLFSVSGFSIDRLSADVEMFVPDDTIASLEALEVVLCEKFDTMVTLSNSMIADYHNLVQDHGHCEQVLKELTASGNSNVVANNVQLLQNAKALVEQDMVMVEDAEGQIWKMVQEMQFIRK